jgi:outer membrane protein assembly factor BamB
MMRRKMIAIGMLATLVPTLLQGSDGWWQFRGDNGRSASSSRPPEQFGGEEKVNIAWRQPTLGRGVGSPLIVNGLVIVTGSGGQDERDIYVQAFDASSGEPAWSRTATALGRPFTHPTSANASPTPVTDGQRVYALFSSCDLLCYDLDGQLQWYRALAVDYPKTGNDVSMSSSPVVIDDTVLVQLENQGDSFVAGIDAKTGENLWRTDRPRRANWASPLAITLPDGRSAFVLQNDESVEVVAAKTGQSLYEFSLPGSTVASPVYAAPRLLVPASGLTVIDFTSASPNVLYESQRMGTRSASHVVVDDRVYACRGSVLVAGDIDQGDVLWQQRLPNIESVWATPVATATGIYVFDQTGNVALVRDRKDTDDPTAELVSQTTVEGPVLASPAVFGDALFVRSENAIYKISAESSR